MAEQAGTAERRPSGTTSHRCLRVVAAVLFASLASGPASAAEPATPGVAPARAAAAVDGQPPSTRPADKPATPQEAEAARLQKIGAAKTWGYQLNSLTVDTAAATPYDLLVVDATAGLAGDTPFTAAKVAQLKQKPDGTRRLVISYLSIGEAEEFSPFTFNREYVEEDAPDWLMGENPKSKGNRLVRFCSEGWQRTIIGDDTGRSLYNSLEAAPLQRLIELGFDGVYLDRADVYTEVAKECPDGRSKMIQFVERIAASARRAAPGFLVVLQNAEELLADPRVVTTIDAAAKEALFYGIDPAETANSAKVVAASIAHLKRARAAGRPVFVVDYVNDKTKRADVKSRSEANGFVSYIAPRDLSSLWLPGVDF